MPAPVESALATLLPTVAFLPPELISLSNSLLAQSRSKAATLKPEEEIGRNYICCHIACERLAKKLDLEIGKPNPPVKPRVYSKLKTWFETALSNVGSNPATPKTPGGRQRDFLKTPTSRASSIRRSPLVKAPKTTTSALSPIEDVALPGWTRGMANGICNHFKTPDLALRTLTGADAVYRNGKAEALKSSQTPGSKRKRTPRAVGPDLLADASLPMLIAVLYASLAAIDRGEAFEQFYTRERNRVMLFVMDYYDNNPDLFGEGPNANEIDQALDHWAKQANNVWPDMEWYQAASIHTNTSGGETGQDMDETVARLKPHPQKTPLRRKEKHGGPIDTEEVGRAGIMPGLGTMFQPAVDWLSSERCAEYAEWRSQISRELDAIEAGSQQRMSMAVS